eukprot:2633381-Pleurochrysis_carterae.AAC.8
MHCTQQPRKATLFRFVISVMRLSVRAMQLAHARIVAAAKVQEVNCRSEFSHSEEAFVVRRGDEPRCLITLMRPDCGGLRARLQWGRNHERRLPFSARRRVKLLLLKHALRVADRIFINFCISTRSITLGWNADKKTAERRIRHMWSSDASAKEQPGLKVRRPTFQWPARASRIVFTLRLHVCESEASVR